MSDVKSDEFLKLIKAVFDPSTDVIRAYIDKKIIQDDPDFGSLAIFLHKNKHNFYHNWKPTNPCCICQTSFGRNKNYLPFENRYYFKLYENDDTRTCTNVKKNGCTHCICRINPKKDVSLDDFDIPVLYCIIKQFGKPVGAPLVNIQNLLDIRNTLCHFKATDDSSNRQLQEKWTNIEDSTYALADEISPYYRRSVEENMKTIRNYELQSNQVAQLRSRLNDALNDLQEDLNDLEERTTEIATKVSEQSEQIEDIKKCVQNELGKLKEDFKEIVVATVIRSLSDFFCVESRVGMACSKQKDEHGNLSNLEQNSIDLTIDAESPQIDEYKVKENMGKEISNDETTSEEKSKTLKVKSIQSQCIHFELTASPEVFKDKESLSYAIDNFIDRLLKAGEVDVNKPGKLCINITVKSQITEEQKNVVFSLFVPYEDISERERLVQDKMKLDEGKLSIKQENDLSEEEHQHTYGIDSDDTELESDLDESYVRDCDDVSDPKRRKVGFNLRKRLYNIPRKMKRKSLIATAGSHPGTKTFQIGNLHFDVRAAEIEEIHDIVSTKDKQELQYAQWIWNFPAKWKVSSVAETINKNAKSLKDWFELDYVFVDITGNLILLSHTGNELFSSSSQFEVGLKTFIDKICDTCNLQSDTLEKINIDILIREGGEIWKIVTGCNTDEDKKEDTSQEKREKKKIDKLAQIGVLSLLDYQRGKVREVLKGYSYSMTPSKLFIKKYLTELEQALKYSTRGYEKRHHFYQRWHYETEKKQYSDLFPMLDLLHREKSERCSSCNSRDVMCFDSTSFKLSCLNCMDSKNFKSNLCIKDAVLASTLTCCDADTRAINILNNYNIQDIKYLTTDLPVILAKQGTRYLNEEINVALWIISDKDEEHSLNVRDKYAENAQIAIISSSKVAFTTLKAVYIAELTNSLSNIKIFEDDADELGGGVAFVNDLLFVDSGSKIIKMDIVGTPLGSIDVEYVKRMYSFGTSMYYISNRNYIKPMVFDTITNQTRILDHMPKCIGAMDFTKHGDIVFSYRNAIWCTLNEGRNCQFVMSQFTDRYIDLKFFLDPKTTDMYVPHPSKDIKEVRRYIVAWPGSTQSASTSTDKQAEQNIDDGDDQTLKFDMTSKSNLAGSREESHDEAMSEGSDCSSSVGDMD